MLLKQHKSIAQAELRGFTIVELLIVIVVIGILAAISIVAFSSVINGANDAAVQSDLRSQGDLITANGVGTNIYPYDETTLSQQQLRVAKSSYGTPIVDGGTGYKYNALYCSTIAGYTPSSFAIISGSASGKIYSYLSTTSKVSIFPTSSWTGSGWGTICPAILGVSTGNSSAGVWLYENSIWKVWLSS